MLLRRKVFKMT
ncbi:hypothetical protein YPPY09_1435, partial [Yersinia pestis PY-09]